MNYFKNKNILITGASSGIGECFANTLNKLDAKLILTARTEKKLKQMCDNMNNAIYVAGDLSDKNFSKELYDELKNKKIKIDILINNAGFGFSGLFLKSSIKNYEEMLNVNIYSLISLTHLFLKDMAADKSGGIINISSLASFQPIPYFSMYAASKAFVTSFTLGLHEEYRDLGIRILGVCPGYTKTNFNKRAQMDSVPVTGYLMTSQEVVDQSLKAYENGKLLIINGRINRFAKMLMSFLPTNISLKLSKIVIKKGMNKKQW